MINKFSLKVISTLGLFLAISLFLFAPAKAADNFVLQPGEELFYEVSFLGVKLGSVKVITEQTEILDGANVYKTKAYIDSYSGIPFVDLHSIFEAWIDESVTYSHKFEGHTKCQNDWDYHLILYNSKKKTINNEKWLRGDILHKFNFSTQKKWNDGLSIFFLARKYLYLKRNIVIPTIVDKDTVTTAINFVGNQDYVKIDAVDYSVNTIYFNGKANWTGLYGLTGNFEGWFSNDYARIPIKAKMNVYVGNVVIELKTWKRAGWSPPR